MKTLLLITILLCHSAGSGVAQEVVRGAGASAAATLTVQVVVAAGAAFSWDREGDARAQADSGIAVQAGRARALLIEIWRSPAAPTSGGRSRELVAGGQVVLRPDTSDVRRGVLGEGLSAALKTAAREPGRYTVAVVY